MKKFLLLISMIGLGAVAFAQHVSPLVVKDFANKPNEIIDKDQIPKQNRKDSYGNRIARIKVKAQGFDEALLQSFTFIPEGFEITHTVFKNGQWYLHVSSKRNGELIIKYMGDCVFRLPYQLEPDKVYELTLSMETATLIIRATPEEAKIYIDNELSGTGYASKAVSIGAEHRYKVVCNDYFPKEGIELLSKRMEKELDIELDPDFGWITVTTNPKGANVIIDGEKVGKTPYVYEKIKKGQHVVEVSKELFATVVQTITVNNGEINNELENLVLNESDETFGVIAFNTIPDGADIIMNDEFKGKTPKTIKNLTPGLKKVELKKQGYAIIEKKLILSGNDTITVDERLEKACEVTITTGEPFDRLFINGVYAGQSPLTLILKEGNYNMVAARGVSDTETNDLKMLQNNELIVFAKKSFTVGNNDKQSVTVGFPEGASKGVFAVADGKRVRFSTGNLQYQASTKTFRFAEQQTDCNSEKSRYPRKTSESWVELFCWGTGKEPSNNWLDDSYYNSFSDWGNNPISNGKGYKWRTLTMQEWTYVLFYRKTDSGMRFAKAQINGVNGLILLPDNWNTSLYALKNADKQNSGYKQISIYEWKTIFEPNGAVFLPAGGYRYNLDNLVFVNERGFYWSSSFYNARSTKVYHLYFSDGSVTSNYFDMQSKGFNVRLVTDVVRESF